MSMQAGGTLRKRRFTSNRVDQRLTFTADKVDVQCPGPKPWMAEEAVEVLEEES
jgi:hypothetical protein